MLFILNKIGQFCKNVIKLCSLYNLLGLSASCYMNSVRSRVIYVFKFWILFCVQKLFQNKCEEEEGGKQDCFSMICT